MSSRLCKHIVQDVATHDIDRAGKLNASPEQKVTAALRVLCYGVSADARDEYVRMNESTINLTLRRFATAISELYGPKYLRSPTREDVAYYAERNAKRGHPGMFGSIDCCHFEWDMCPTALRGQHLNKDHNVTNILEAIATDDCWIWHAFFGMPGSCNDLNVLNASPFIQTLMQGGLPDCRFTVNGTSRLKPYVLTDGIYPPWLCFQKGFSEPVTEEQKLYATIVSALRKDVERAFGILRKRFNFLKVPCRLWFIEDIVLLMKCCLILHNMIVEDERDEIDVQNRLYFLDELEAHVDETIQVDGVAASLERETPLTELVRNMLLTRDKDEHFALRNDLMAHVWNLNR